MVLRRKYLFFFLILFLLPTAVDAADKQKRQSILKAALVVDYETGDTLYEYNADRLIQPASLSKMLALYLINEDLRAGRIHLSDPVKISSNAVRTGGSKMLYQAGKEVSLNDLIKGMAVISANDATVAVAEHLAGNVDKFVDRMNAKVRNLGMTHSFFVNPHGLPDNRQLTTARDMLILSRHYLQRFPDMLHIHSALNFRYNHLTYRNRNLLLKDSLGVDGLKTGYVRASGHHLLATAKRGNVRLLAVGLGARKHRLCADQINKLLDMCFRLMEEKRAASLIGG